jgi:orotidine-5'-phosphate decarboxylase
MANAIIQTMQARDRLIVAVDLSSREDILSLVDELRGTVGCFKIGLQAFVANGPDIVREIVRSGEKVFLDLKIHDIPNTARHAVAEAVSLCAHFVTVHAAGGSEMLRACADSAADTLVLGVTVLTSLDDEELRRIGFVDPPLETALGLARLAKSSGLRGVVASPLEVHAIRTSCGEGFVIVTPGIRPAGSDADDQRRTLTPGEAIATGADYIVVGRPITGAGDRRAAAERIVEEIGGAK